MFKRLFVLFLCAMVSGSVLARDLEQEVITQELALIWEEVETKSYQDDEVQSAVSVQFVEYQEKPLALQVSIVDDRTVIVRLTTENGSAAISVSTEKPELIAALKMVTLEVEEKLLDIAIGHLDAFLKNYGIVRNAIDYSIFCDTFAQKLAHDIEVVLSEIAQKIESVQESESTKDTEVAEDKSGLEVSQCDDLLSDTVIGQEAIVLLN